MARTKCSRGRIIAWVVAVVLAVGGIVFLYLAHVAEREYYEIVDAKPFDIRVDFSSPGEFSGELHQTCGMCDSEGLWLVVPGDWLGDADPVDAWRNKRRGVQAGASAQGAS